MIELEISFIHNAFVGDLTFGAAQDYGKGRIFRERLAIVQASAASLFRVRPCQTVEGNFQHLILQVEGFSNRRNDIAHGIVFQIDNITFFSEKLLANARGKRQSACIPPYYALRKHADGFPSYAYTYQLLMDLQRKLQLLNIKLRYFRSSLAGYCDGWHPGPQ